MNRKPVALLGACTLALYNLSNDSDDLMSKTVEEDWMVLV